MLRVGVLCLLACSVNGNSQGLFDAVRSGNIERTKALLSDPSLVNIRDAATGRTPLHEAIAARNVEIVRLLLEAGANPTTPDDKGVRPFDLGIAMGDRAIVTLLVGARLKTPKQQAHQAPSRPSTLYDVVLRGKADYVRMLLDMRADPNQRAPDGSTPLDAASLKGNVQIVELLLARGAAVDIRARSGSTALHDAALGGNAKVAEILLAHGADLEARDSDGLTPLFYAVQMDRRDVAESLLKKGAHTDVRNARGRGMIGAAQENGSDAMAALLRKYGARE